MINCIIPTQRLQKQTNKQTIRCLWCSKAMCTIQEGCTANGIKKKLDGLKGKCLSEKMKVIITFITCYCLFIKCIYI